MVIFLLIKHRYYSGIVRRCRFKKSKQRITKQNKQEWSEIYEAPTRWKISFATGVELKNRLSKIRPPGP